MVRRGGGWCTRFDGVCHATLMKASNHFPTRLAMTCLNKDARLIVGVGGKALRLVGRYSSSSLDELCHDSTRCLVRKGTKWMAGAGLGNVRLRR